MIKPPLHFLVAPHGRGRGGARQQKEPLRHFEVRDDAGPERRTGGQAGLIAKDVEGAQFQQRLGELLESALERSRELAVDGVAVRDEGVVPFCHGPSRTPRRNIYSAGDPSLAHVLSAAEARVVRAIVFRYVVSAPAVRRPASFPGCASEPV
ncbi:hypothetical protein MES5069_1360004 [Mesorhizobium escarrei]|uniref:Uncharacterized protein n=1 Tax=Mesorhizobium escarrei TaxID=666018 RepID=A0ABM9DKU6_9HYPH|nr:hypothetical protein MES5069_1360004 [Mesorhizobium escarrei]